MSTAQLAALLDGCEWRAPVPRRRPELAGCLKPGRGRTKTGRLWCYAVDDRPWCGPGPPVAAYVYSEDRKGLRPAGHLAAFRGVLQVDGYAGFKRLAGDRADGSVGLAFCWAHMRRYFYEFHVSTKSPLAAEVLAQIQALYAIESQIRGHPAEHRRQARQERSRPVVEALHARLQAHQGRVSAASDLAKAIRYALRHWPGLTLFLDDGRVEMDSNVVERAIRPVALNRKNASLLGPDPSSVVVHPAAGGLLPSVVGTAAATPCCQWGTGEPICSARSRAVARRLRSFGFAASRVPAGTPLAARRSAVAARAARQAARVGASAPSPQRKVVPSSQILCRTVANLRASATLARLTPRLAATATAQRFSGEKRTARVRMTVAASYSAVRAIASPARLMPPVTSVSPDWYLRGVRPR